MTKIISDVQIKRMMKIYNPKREWTKGCVEVFRENTTQMIYYLLGEIENNIQGSKRIQPQDIVDAYNIWANAIARTKLPLSFYGGEE
tara:strand:- start:159 stop:419 length:261 start_codon:yes stop_codon:yes gene_type:complete